MTIIKDLPLKDYRENRDNLLSTANGDKHNFNSTAELLQTIYEEEQDPIILFNAKGDLRIECNTKAYEFFEIDSKDILSSIEIFKYLKESLKIGKGNNILCSISGTGVWNGEVKFETKNGKPLWGKVAIRIVKITDNDYYLIRIVKITCKKMAIQGHFHYLTLF